MLKELINMADTFFNECILIATLNASNDKLTWIKPGKLIVREIGTYSELRSILLKEYSYDEEERDVFDRMSDASMIVNNVDINGKYSYTYRAKIDGKFTWVTMVATHSVDYTQENPLYLITFRVADPNIATMHNSYSIMGTVMHKVISVNLNTDRCTVHYSDDKYTSAVTDVPFKTWIAKFISDGNIHSDDVELVKEFSKESNLVLWTESHAKGSCSVKYRRKYKDGWKWAKMYVTRSHTYSDDERTVVIYVRDIDHDEAASIETIKSLSKYANYDDMTGCRNKRLYEEEIRSDRTPTIVIYADVNGLKTINDTKGHNDGDKVIVRLATLLKSIFGKDCCYRVGGDEFVVICYDNVETVQYRMMRLTEQLRDKFAAIGWCFDPSGRAVKSKMVEVAEKRMYEDKALPRK